MRMEGTGDTSVVSPNAKPRIRSVGLMVAEGTRADVAYRLEGRERKLGFVKEVAYGVGEDRVSLTTKNEDLEPTWCASGI